jgi:chemotaxis protein MotB
MVQSRVMGRSGQQDWLPWALSIFVASCAVFVLVRGVLPARNENAELTQQVARLERDLSRATQDALEQRATIERATKGSDSPAAAAADAPDDARTRAAARKEFSQSFAAEIGSGAVLLEERQGEFVVDIMNELIFDPGRADVSKKGRKFLKDLAVSMKRLPASQVFQIGGHTDRGRTEDGGQHHPADWKLSALRAANIARFLEESGDIPGEQLVAAGFSGYRPPSNARANTGPRHPRVEIVLLSARH